MPLHSIGDIFRERRTQRVFVVESINTRIDEYDMSRHTEYVLFDQSRDLRLGVTLSSLEVNFDHKFNDGSYNASIKEKIKPKFRKNQTIKDNFDNKFQIVKILKKTFNPWDQPAGLHCIYFQYLLKQIDVHVDHKFEPFWISDNNVDNYGFKEA